MANELQNDQAAGAGAAAAASTGQSQVSQGQATQNGAQSGSGGGDPWAAKGWKDINDAWKSYSELEGKLGQQGNELGQYRDAFNQTAKERSEYEKALQAWDKWYQNDIAPHWDDVQKFLQTKQGKQVAAQVAQATGAQTNAGQNWQEGWEGLSPQQQAQRLQEVAVQQVAGALTPALQDWQRKFVAQVQGEIAQKEAYFNNYLNLYRKVMDMRMKDPSLNVDEVLDQAVKVLGGQMDPIELGQKLATMGVDRENYGKQMVEQARKDWETEQKNKEMAAVQPRAGGTPPAFKLANAGSTKNGLNSLRESVAKQLIDKHGPGIF